MSCSHGFTRKVGDNENYIFFYRKKGLVMTINPIKHFSTKQHNLYLHLARNALIGFFLIALALGIGMLGYHALEGMSWIDAFINASMILSGMGPETAVLTTGGKLFAGFYALFSGLAFVAIVAIMLAPAIHVFFRKIHLESGGRGQS